MNRVIFIFFFFMPFALANSNDFEVVLEFQTHLGFFEKWVLKREDNSIFLNGKILTSTRILHAKEMISYLVTNNYRNPASSYCPAGNYAYSVKDSAKKSNIENGCIDTKRFSILLRAFKAI